MADIDFDKAFCSLTGHPPFPWQESLYDRFVSDRDDNIPSICDLPTGLGKTSVIVIWLIALAKQRDKMPRRLVYVVNRRTVVDQTTNEVEKLRHNLQGHPSLEALRERLGTLAISTLRGQFADNGEWRDDPARPAVVCGTVDMIGSRLLFSGYRRGFKSKPTHAGLLGHDTLIVHDEAHLEPAFQNLLESIHSQQRSDNGECNRCIRVLELTATSRTEDDGRKPFTLTDLDYKHKLVRQRLFAKKGIEFHAIEDPNKGKLDAVVAAKALQDDYKSSGQAILIYLRKVEDVNKVVGTLRKAFRGQDNVETLTGTLRGLERDRMADPRRSNASRVFARFLPRPNPDAPESEQWQTEPLPGTVYLVCTSAGEVGVNISADHLICDLTPFDSMAQRFGRVNRFGDGDAKIDVIHEAEIDTKKTEYEARRLKTVELLQQLSRREDGRHDACPHTLGKLNQNDRLGAFSPQPTTLHVDDILFDAWAMTTIYDELPGRPQVADWLHGVTDNGWDPPQTHVAWREEVGEITGKLLEKHPPNELLEDYPLKPHELLRDNSDRVFMDLQALAKSHGEKPVWVLDAQGHVERTDLKSIADPDAKGPQAKRLKVSIQHKTVLLPHNIGGLEKGLLKGASKYDPQTPYDVADEWSDEHGRRRLRYFTTDNTDEETVSGADQMREIRTIIFSEDNEEIPEGTETAPRVWHWCVRPRAADPSWRSREEQLLADHLNSAEDFATRIVNKLDLDEQLSSAVVIAAKYHDLGKDRKLWQIGIGNRAYPGKVLAKSNNHRRPNHHYRHEFGSLLDIRNQPDFQSQPEEMQELILHLIAAHHGRGRPHFPSMESYDPEHTEDEADAMAAAVPRRFARLQRRYGRWGLAYLESLVRAADVMASQTAEEQAVRKGKQP